MTSDWLGLGSDNSRLDVAGGSCIQSTIPLNLS